MKKFKRSTRAWNTKDETGTVRVVISPVDSMGKTRKGNIHRSFTLKDAQVGEVATALEKVLVHG